MRWLGLQKTDRAANVSQVTVSSQLIHYISTDYNCYEKCFCYTTVLSPLDDLFRLQQGYQITDVNIVHWWFDNGIVGKGVENTMLNKKIFRNRHKKPLTTNTAYKKTILYDLYNLSYCDIFLKIQYFFKGNRNVERGKKLSPTKRITFSEG